MRKALLSFRAIRRGNSLHRFFLGDKCRRVRKAALGVAAAVCISAGVSAQCDTFRDADAANPLLPVFSTGKTIAGFAFADIDGDGDQDLYVDFKGDTTIYGDPGTYYEKLNFYRNTGTKTHPVFIPDSTTGFGNALAGSRSGEMQFVDIDGDGDLDYFTSSVTYDYYGYAYVFSYENVGTFQKPSFVPHRFTFVPYMSANYIQPFAFADVDGDGDYDLYTCEINPYIISSYYQKVYYNTGTATQPNYSTYKYNDDNGTIYRTYYDWNEDGLTDYFDATVYYNNRAYAYYYKNLGPKNNPEYVRNPADRPKFTKGGTYRLLDLNNDGAPESFDLGAHYSTLVPVAVIKDSVLQNGSTALYSLTRKGNYTYRWELNGKTIAGATNYYIVPKRYGVYTLYITDGCGTGVSLNYKFTKSSGLTAGDRTANLPAMDIVAVKAYPNPFVNTITLQLPGNSCTVKVTDMAGRILLSQSTSAATLQVGQHLKSGSYIVTIYQQGKTLFTTTIVKQ